MRLQPHLHALFLDGAYREQDADLAFHPLAHLSTREVADVERTIRTMNQWLRRRGMLQGSGDTEDADDHDGLAALAASAVSGVTPPAGPSRRRGALPLTSHPLKFERELCVALDGFTLHAATRAGGQHQQAREALLKYILRPAVAQERVSLRPDGLVSPVGDHEARRVALKKPFADGTGQPQAPCRTKQHRESNRATPSACLERRQSSSRAWTRSPLIHLRAQRRRAARGRGVRACPLQAHDRRLSYMDIARSSREPRNLTPKRSKPYVPFKHLASHCVAAFDPRTDVWGDGL